MKSQFSFSRFAEDKNIICAGVRGPVLTVTTPVLHDGVQHQEHFMRRNQLRIVAFAMTISIIGGDSTCPTVRSWASSPY